MPSLQVVIIWFLSVILGGVLITAGILYCTRDAGQRASGARSPRRTDAATLQRWQAGVNAARRRMEAPAVPLASLPDPGRPTTYACSGVGHRFCDGTRHIAPGETEPCECWCHKPAPAVLDSCGRPPAAGSAAAGLWQIIPARPPVVDQAAAVALSCALIAANVRRVYADAEAQQVCDLAQTAWSTWA